MWNGLTLAVIVPAYNEAEKIAAAIFSVPSFVDRVFVIDDASSDRTAEIAQKSRREGLEVISHLQNRGVGAAIVTGYRRALELDSDVAIVMAGDGQMDPADLPALLTPIVEKRADYVKGNRFLRPGAFRAMPPSRLFGNIVLSLATQLATGHYGLFDSQCGYTAITRSALLAIDLSQLFPRYGYPNDVLARLKIAGIRVCDAPVRAVYGPSWRSGIRVWRVVVPILGVLARAVALRFRHRKAVALQRRPQQALSTSGGRELGADTQSRRQIAHSAAAISSENSLKSAEF